MLNGEEYKLFLQSNCLLCKKYKGTSDDNCGTYRKIEISQYTNGAMFPLKDLKEVPNVLKYSCKKLDSKDNNKPLVQASMDPVRKIEKVSQIKMF